jgi:hypothetical protein
MMNLMHHSYFHRNYFGAGQILPRYKSANYCLNYNRKISYFNTPFASFQSQHMQWKPKNIFTTPLQNRRNFHSSKVSFFEEEEDEPEEDILHIIEDFDRERGLVIQVVNYLIYLVNERMAVMSPGESMIKYHTHIYTNSRSCYGT